MRKLGISIYPEKSTKERILKYIDEAHEAGFSRIFSCLLSAEEDKENIKKTFKSINEYASKKGFEIIVEVKNQL